MELIIALLVSVGVTNLIVNSSILEPVRTLINNLLSKVKIFRIFNLHKGLDCMMCTGFWVGIIIGFYFGINMLTVGAIASMIAPFYSYIDNLVFLKISKTELIIDDMINNYDDEDME